VNGVSQPNSDHYSALLDIDNRIDTSFDQFKGEFLNFIRVSSTKDNTEASGVADWSGDFDREGVYIPYPLVRGETDTLSDLLSGFEDTILPKHAPMPAGQAEIGEEFDIELKDDMSLERLSNAKNRSNI